MGKSGLAKWLGSLVSVIYPDVCEICGHTLVEGEKVICTHCNLDMPRPNFHLQKFSELQQRLFCHCPIENAAAMFNYVHEGKYGSLIRKLKYNGRRDIGRNLGAMFAQELAECDFFNGISLLLPVPVHFSKKIKRGYNQSEIIAEGISRTTGIEIGDHLIAKRKNKSQTHKGSDARWKETEGIFEIRNADELAGRHVLIIDDIITTGATMVRCCEALHSASPTTRVSVFSLGSTKKQ